jgi:hypothetical protein
MSAPGMPPKEKQPDRTGRLRTSQVYEKSPIVNIKSTPPSAIM